MWSWKAVFRLCCSGFWYSLRGGILFFSKLPSIDHVLGVVSPTYATISFVLAIGIFYLGSRVLYTFHRSNKLRQESVSEQRSGGYTFPGLIVMMIMIFQLTRTVMHLIRMTMNALMVEAWVRCSSEAITGEEIELWTEAGDSNVFQRESWLNLAEIVILNFIMVIKKFCQKRRG